VRHNWAGNVRFSTDRVLLPRSVGELCAAVRAGSGHLHGLGSGHSFSDVADTDGTLVSLAELPPVIDVDPGASTVTVSAGLRWGDLAPDLHRAGFALHTLGSLPHISVAGSCATGTHGSGVRATCLAAAVRALEVVTASGELVTAHRGDPDFGGYPVALGALGVVTSLTLDVEPAYDMRQTVVEHLPWAVAIEQLDAVMGSADSVSLFTTWQGDTVEQVWLKQRIPAPARVNLEWTGAVPADGPRHPIRGMSAQWCTEQLGRPGPWYARLPHFRLEFTPSSGEELQTEYLVPRQAGAQALAAVRDLRDQVSPVLQISEIRTVAADDLWLSPACGRDSLAIHFTWVPAADAVLPVVAEVERVLRPFGARPHWGKLFTMGADELAALYPRMPDFTALRRRLDPDGRFDNAFLGRVLR
jgi:xylitol oxidase